VTPRSDHGAGRRRLSREVGVVALTAVLVATGLLGVSRPAAAVAAVAEPRVSAAPDLVVGEGDGSVDLPVTLSAPGQSVVTVGYNLSDSTAVAGTDYMCPTPGCGNDTLTFAPGETTKTVRIDILDDHVAEPTETFLLNLFTPTSATIARAHTQVTIVDND
jgi:chitinase